MFNEETWKPVADCPGYEVSNLGQVRSVPRAFHDRTGRLQVCRGRILKTHLNLKTGYLATGLGARNTRAVHVLVARAFIPNPLGLREVNHEDGVKTNNVPGNLGWTSHSGNAIHARRVLKINIRAKHPRAKLSEDQVAEIRTLRGCLSLSAIGRRFGVSRSTIYLIFAGVNWINHHEP